MVGPDMQDFGLRINMLKEFKKKSMMNYGLSKSVEIVLSKSIFYVKNQRNFSKKKSFKNIKGDYFL